MHWNSIQYPLTYWYTTRKIKINTRKKYRNEKKYANDWAKNGMIQKSTKNWTNNGMKTIIPKIDSKNLLTNQILICCRKSAHSLWPNDSIYHPTSGSALAHVMACCLLGTKSLHEPMLTYCQFGQWNFYKKYQNLSEISIKNTKIFFQETKHSFRKMHVKMSEKWQPFCSCWNALKLSVQKSLIRTQIFFNHYPCL